MAMEAQPDDRGATVMERVQRRASADGGRGARRRRARRRGHARRRRDRRGRGDRRPAPGRGGGVRAVADLAALRRYVGERARNARRGGAGGRRRRGADRHRRRAARRRAAARRRRARARRARVPARGRGRVPDRGRRRGGAAGGRAEPARLVPGGAARARRSRSRRGAAPRGAARLRPLARRRGAVRGAVFGSAAARRGDDRRASIRARWPSTWTAAAAQGACTRCCRGADARRDPGRGAPAGGAAAAPRHGRRVVVLRRRRRPRPRDPGGRARAGRPAPLGRADRRGHRHRHLPAAVPRAGVAPRGGALVLRGHRRAAGGVRRAVLDGSGGDFVRLPGAQLQHERDRLGDLRAPAHGRLSAGAREGADRASTRCCPRIASGWASA